MVIMCTLFPRIDHHSTYCLFRMYFALYFEVITYYLQKLDWPMLLVFCLESSRVSILITTVLDQHKSTAWYVFGQPTVDMLPFSVYLSPGSGKQSLF